uniref:ANF_receptor domain-containing protein n=1 Tax=Heterorhabditis bacteriophora TaxID=37862 RepID=A0A1I7WBN8_HETBA
MVRFKFLILIYILEDVGRGTNGSEILISRIAMKQNKYPVLFLCVGETQRYTRFQDQRSSTSLTAVNFAAGADIMVRCNFAKLPILKWILKKF